MASVEKSKGTTIQPFRKSAFCMYVIWNAGVPCHYFLLGLAESSQGQGRVSGAINFLADIITITIFTFSETVFCMQSKTKQREESCNKTGLTAFPLDEFEKFTSSILENFYILIIFFPMS